MALSTNCCDLRFGCGAGLHGLADSFALLQHLNSRVEQLPCVHDGLAIQPGYAGRSLTRAVDLDTRRACLDWGGVDAAAQVGSGACLPSKRIACQQSRNRKLGVVVSHHYRQRFPLADQHDQFPVMRDGWFRSSMPFPEPLGRPHDHLTRVLMAQTIRNWAPCLRSRPGQ
jgi:hypothetical protein